MTVLLMSNTPRTSELWRYLVEDTYGRRGEFEPAKIEPRWFSRSLFVLLAVCLAAFFLVRIVRLGLGGQPLAMSGLPKQITADLGNLDIRPADPALQPNAEIYADAATMQKLANKLASAQGNAGAKGSIGQWLDKARKLGGTLQNEITGAQRRPPVQLRLTDKDPALSQGSHHTHGGATPGGENGSSHANTGSVRNGLRPAPTPGQMPNELTQNGVGLPSQLANDSSQTSPGDLAAPASGGAGSGGGATHGSGADPEHLFGPLASQPLGGDSFKITIDAQPSDESSTPGAPAYIPPEIRAPLNDQQHDDEPIARAAVPAADQMTIKRVFER